MRQASILITTLIGALQTAAAFDFERDSCTPAAGTFALVPAELKSSCTVTGEVGRAASINCVQGTLFLDFRKNQIQIIMRPEHFTQSMNIHGACMKEAKQIAHLDVHIATPAEQVYNHIFNAFNRKCDGDQVVFDTFVMDEQRLHECATNPVKPVR